MENVLLVNLSRQMALRRELDVIANNVANVNTNGFKRRSAEFREFLMPGARADDFKQADQRVSYVVDQRSPLDMRAGAVEYTGNPLDVAIKGDALFVVQTPQGERYTRNGALNINALGQLVTSDGYPVLGAQGPFQFSADDSQIRIAADGTLSTAQGVRGKLRLVNFDSPQQLRNEGLNLFSSAQPLAPAVNIQLEPNYVERSNVKSVLEISRLIEVSRAYQAMTQMMSRTDEMRRNAISRLGDVA